jgi:hypothetical protein
VVGLGVFPPLELNVCTYETDVTFAALVGVGGVIVVYAPVVVVVPHWA